MKTTMRLMLALAVAALSGIVAKAQTHEVFVFAGNEIEQPIINALKAKIGATTRYVLVDRANFGAIWVGVNCLAVGQERGYVCSYHTTYFPASIHPFTTTGPGNMFTGSDRLSIAEMIFEDFVKGTSDKEIEASISSRRNEVATFCKDPANKRYCQPLADTKAE